MTWLAALLLGVAVTDLLRAAWPARVPHEAVGAAGAVLVGLLAGLTSPVDVVGLLVTAALVLAWGRCVRRWGGAAERRRDAALALLVLGAGVVLAVVAAPAAAVAAGPWGEWLSASPFPLLADLDPSRGMLVAGVLAVQLSTGNVVVRLVLTVTETGDPSAAAPGVEDPATRLRGGRLLGPMERLVIVGLGLAGQLTAASIVIAAKGLLRWPELHSRSEQQWIHRLTEYFLVGSFVSWLVALGALALVV